MFLNEEQLKGNINTVDRQLMYDIREEMRRSNELLTKLLNGFNREEKVELVSKSIPCKFCGGTHENKGQLMACARKKKE
jgi:hypothetical protein